MAGEWRDGTLADVVTFTSGGTPSKDRSDYWGGRIPWVSAKDMKRFRLDDTEDHVTEIGAANGTRVAPAGSVLLLVRGMTLHNDVPICLTTRPMAFNQDVKALCATGLRGDFLPYLLLGQKQRLMSVVDLAGHGTGRLNTDELKSLEISIPPDAEQHAIAHILGTLDDKIELNRRMSETLEAMARALFKSWFVDFDPVRAKMEGRWQRGQSLPGLPAHLYDIFPDRLVDSELGEIPESWEPKRIGDLAEVVGGSTPRTNEARFWEGGVHHWATPKDLSALAMPVLLDTERKVTDAGLTQISSGLLPTGTVLLSSRAPIGYLAVAEIPTAINQGFIAMKPRDGLSSLFLLFWASASLDEIVSYANGSTFLEISKANFRPIQVVAPTAKVMTAFDNLARPLYDHIVENERESRALATLRDTLLPKLISGEVRIHSADKFIRSSA